MKRILLCSLKYDKNFGDSIINDCCKYIIEEVLNDKNDSDYIIDEIDLTGKKSFNESFFVKKINYYSRLSVKKTLSLFLKLCKILKLHKLANYIEIVSWNLTDEKYILKKININIIKNSNIIIFTGGGMLKYKYQNCYQYINFVTKVADEFNIPVYLNSVGVEGIDLKNPKCRLLKKAINRNCVKMITTRDDINTLKLYIDNSRIIYGKVSDPAVYTSIVYNTKKNKSSDIIGLGVCRGDLFLDNGINISEDNLLNIWKNIINELDSRNIEWNIYTNGLEADNEFARKFIDKFNIEKSKLLIPSSPKELVQIISNFKGIIATRLHSCIISYSLNIPAIGLVWNNKLKMFGENIGYSERFIEKQDFNSKHIINQLLKSLDEEYAKMIPEDYIKTEIDSLKKFFELYYNEVK